MLEKILISLAATIVIYGFIFLPSLRKFITGNIEDIYIEIIFTFEILKGGNWNYGRKRNYKRTGGNYKKIKQA